MSGTSMLQSKIDSISRIPNSRNRWSPLKTSATLAMGSGGLNWQSASNQGRRVMHSAGNFFSGTYDRLRGNSWQENVEEGIDAGNSGVGLLATAATFAAAGGCTAAFTAAMAGPQAGVTLGVIGLVLLAKDAYSNREAAHNELQPYVWSIVDNAKPTSVPSFEQLKKLAAAGLTLQEDGKNQFQLLQSKYNDRYTRYFDHIKKITDQIDRINRASSPVARRGLSASQLAGKQAVIKEARQEAKRLLAEGEGPGGAIWEFVRRCSHISNYIQASEIVALAVKTEMSTSNVVDTHFFNTDYFANSKFVEARKIFYATELLLKEAKVI